MSKLDITHASRIMFDVMHFGFREALWFASAVKGVS